MAPFSPEETVSRRNLIKAGAVLGIGALYSGSASACHNSEMRITHAGEYILDEDIIHDDDGTCIHIEADDVTLDGNGHTISGEGGSGVGVYVYADNVTLRNLTISGFETGIECVEHEGLQIENCETRNNGGSGIELSFSQTEILHSEMSDNGSGISGLFSRAYIDNSTIENNDGRGIVNREDFEIEIENSTVSENGHLGISTTFTNSSIRNCEILDNNGLGIIIGNIAMGGNREVPIVGNTIKNNDGAGIRIIEAGLDARENDIEGNAIGVWVKDEASRDAFADLTLRHNNIVENDERAVRNDVAKAVDATCNWWGSEDRPEDDDIEGEVDYIPWATERVEDDDPDCLGSPDDSDDEDGKGEEPEEPVTVATTTTVRRIDDQHSAEYTLEAERGIVDGSKLIGEDKEVTDPPTTASGSVGPDNYEDWFWFDGNEDYLLNNLEIDGYAEVYVDGEVKYSITPDDDEEEEPTPTETPEPTPEPAETPESTSTPEPTETPSAASEPTPSPTATETPTPTETPTDTPTVSPTPTPTPEPPTPTPTETSTPTDTPESMSEKTQLETVEPPGFGWIAGGGGLIGTLSYLLKNKE